MQMALARRIALNFSARFGDALFRTVPQRLGYSSTPPTIDAGLDAHLSPFPHPCNSKRQLPVQAQLDA